MIRGFAAFPYPLISPDRIKAGTAIQGETVLHCPRGHPSTSARVARNIIHVPVLGEGRHRWGRCSVGMGATREPRSKDPKVLQRTPRVP